MRGWPDIFRDLPSDATAWTLSTIGILLGVVIALLLIGDWLSGWWTTNLLRNRLEAKRWLKRQRREPDPKP
jgi:hypothetical protein